MTLPAHMYGDPMQSAMRAEAQRCTGCKHLQKLLGRDFCGRGKRELKRCKKFDETKG